MYFKNKYYLLMIFAVVLGACSPKIRTVKNNNAKPEEKEKPVEKPLKRFTQANVSLLVPFKLNELNLKTVTKAEIEKYAMPIDFYQGFKLGLDSASSTGLNFKLNVFDTEDDRAHIGTVYKNEWFKQSNLIVGPIFPDGIKFISTYSKENNVPVVSPLAASPPSEFNNPNLISVVSNISIHANRIAKYIAKNYNPLNTIVVIINPKKADDEQFTFPIRSYFQLLKSNFVVQEYISASVFETKMVKGKQYAVVIASSDRDFVNPSIEKLYRLKNLKTGGYNINLFGHPNWAKQSYSVEKLQNLGTIISSSYKIDYKSLNVIQFIKKYRALYGFEPGEYAFKGFDIACYFGGLLAKHGEKYIDYLTKERYRGLHNTFSFIRDDQFGYINNHVMLLRYKDYALNQID